MGRNLDMTIQWMLAFTAATSVASRGTDELAVERRRDGLGLTDSGAKVLFADAERLVLLESMAQPIESPGRCGASYRFTGCRY